MPQSSVNDQEILAQIVRLQRPSPLTSLALLRLPPHLKFTALAILRLQEGTAEAVSKLTQRPRDLESRNLEELANMGFLRKELKGKHTWYTINPASPTPAGAYTGHIEPSVMSTH
jgi:hypothetical protein